MTAPVYPTAIALSVARVLEKLGIQHTIGGSIASSFAGEPRSTVDIDFVAALDESQVPALMEALAADFYIDDASLRRAIRTRTSRSQMRIGPALRMILDTDGRPIV